MGLHTLITKVASVFVWGTPERSAKKFFEFALAEQGSMLDLSAAAHLTASEKRRALYVKHLLDEKRHALMFSLRSAELFYQAGRKPYGNLHADIENLFQTLGEIRFLAFVHVGESRACQQFVVYRNWFKKQGDNTNKSLFEAILKDEQRHADYTWDLLVEITGSERAARRELRNVRIWEAWRNWRRVGKSFASKLFVILSLCIYLLIAPYAVLTRLFKRQRKGWIVPALEQEIDRAGGEQHTKSILSFEPLPNSLDVSESR
jgi:hypothetical protein